MTPAPEHTPDLVDTSMKYNTIAQYIHYKQNFNPLTDRSKLIAIMPMGGCF